MTTMTATVTFTINPRDAVPTTGRVEWLEAHGVPPEKQEIRATASLAAWDAAGATVHPDGRVGEGGEIKGALRAAALAIIARDGSCPDDLPEEVVLTALAAPAQEKRARTGMHVADYRDRVARARAEGRLHVLRPDWSLGFSSDGIELTAEQQSLLAEGEYKAVRTEVLAARAAAEAQQRERAATWIGEHGSPRLRRLLAEKIECNAVYRSERIALERPGWRYAAQVPGDPSEARNAPESALELLDRARELEPEARLVYWTVEHAPSCSCADAEEPCPRYAWRGHVVTANCPWDPQVSIVFGGPGAE